MIICDHGVNEFYCLECVNADDDEPAEPEARGYEEMKQLAKYYGFARLSDFLQLELGYASAEPHVGSLDSYAAKANYAGFETVEMWKRAMGQG